MGVIAGGKYTSQMDFGCEWATVMAGGLKAGVFLKIICSPPLSVKFGWRKEEIFLELISSPVLLFIKTVGAGKRLLAEIKLAWSELVDWGFPAVGKIILKA